MAHIDNNNLDPALHQHNHHTQHNAEPRKDFRQIYENKDKEDEKKRKGSLEGIFSLMAQNSSHVNHVEPAGSQRVHSAELPADFQVLFEQLAERLTHESNKGISETVLEIRLANSRFIFNGSQFKITHYDTAPHSFKIQFCGTEQSINAFNKHAADLQLALQKNFREYQIIFAPAILKTEESPNLRPKIKVHRAENELKEYNQDKVNEVKKFHD
jgi:hypothetical protein